MQFAYVMAVGRGDMDVLLHGVAQRFMAEGRRPAGTVQVNSESCDSSLCDMDGQILPDGSVIRISQNLGACSKGCRF